MEDNTKFFPLFINLEDKNILMVGCGNVGSKRAITLSQYKGKITIVSPTITSDVKKLVENKRIKWIEREFEDTDIINLNPFLVVATTNDRKTNKSIMELAKANNILYIISDKREECSAYFPALAEDEHFIIGITSKQGNHKGVKNLAKTIRETLRIWGEK